MGGGLGSTWGLGGENVEADALFLITLEAAAASTLPSQKRPTPPAAAAKQPPQHAPFRPPATVGGGALQGSVAGPLPPWGADAPTSDAANWLLQNNLALFNATGGRDPAAQGPRRW